MTDKIQDIKAKHRKIMVLTDEAKACVERYKAAGETSAVASPRAFKRICAEDRLPWPCDTFEVLQVLDEVACK